VTTSSSELSAWQRWELAALDERAQPSPEAQQAALERARATAAEAGRVAGYRDGMEAALAERARLAALAERLSDHAGVHAQRLADEVLDFAIAVARHLVGEVVSVKRELVLPVVTQALRDLPQTSQRIQIALNPADVELVRSHLGDATSGRTVDLVADPAIAPGGVRVESEQAEIDATLTARWRNVLAGLGRHDDWIDFA
jgi:flagellar assembly protein FliH